MDSILSVEGITDKGVMDCPVLTAHLLPLADLFFNSSFSLLPDFFFYDTL